MTAMFEMFLDVEQTEPAFRRGDTFDRLILRASTRRSFGFPARATIVLSTPSLRRGAENDADKLGAK